MKDEACQKVPHHSRWLTAKWQEVAGSGRKWQEVAGSGRKWQAARARGSRSLEATVRHADKRGGAAHLRRKCNEMDAASCTSSMECEENRRGELRIFDGNAGNLIR
jgi:hypothetical protein